jgi:hypothetical protein
MADSTRCWIDGDTYPIKEQLKELGCRWDKDRRAWYAESEDVAAQARALLKPAPIWNSPPPADLGTAGPAELAARFGRKAVEGAEVHSFVVYGLPKGDDGSRDGTIHGGKGKRYVQVGRTPRRYLSKDFLEDCDLFFEQPGGSYQWDGVEVVPTDEEAEADRAAAEAKAAKEREAAEAKARAEAEKAARLARWEAVKSGLERTGCQPDGPREYTGEAIDFDRHASAREFRLADGRLGWDHQIHAYDDYRQYWHVPADVAHAARLAYAFRAGYTPENCAAYYAEYSPKYGADALCLEAHRVVMEADEATKDRLRASGARLEAEKLAQAHREARAQVRRSAIVRLLTDGWITAETAEAAAGSKMYSRPAARPVAASSVEVRIDDAGIEPYVEARLAHTYELPPITGVSIVLRFPAAAFEAPPRKPRSRKPAEPAPASTVPAEIRVDNHCTAVVVVEKEGD